MNHTPRPTLVTTPPPFKTTLSTTVDAFTPGAYPLALTSKLGKRRLSRHRAWAAPDCACPGWLRIFVTPGWITRTPAGNQKVSRMFICEEGELDQTLAEIQERHGVHLWLAPINFPHTPKVGNWFYRGVSRHSRVRLADELPRWRGVLKAVAA